MKSLFLTTILMLFISASQAQECPSLAGDYTVKIKDSIQNLKINQIECKFFEFNYEYPNGSEFKKILSPDNLEKIIYNDADREIKETTTVEQIKVGEHYYSSLRIDRVEYSYITDENYFTVVNFYSEDKTGKYLVERRDIFDKNKEKISRVYIGYVSKNLTN